MDTKAKVFGIMNEKGGAYKLQQQLIWHIC